MAEIFDLNEMIQEIEEDEKAEFVKNRKMSQEEIQKMVIEKREERSKAHDKQ